MIVHARVAPKRDTTRAWEQKPDFVPFRGEIIIYTDKYTVTKETGETIKVPAMKIGDGKTCIADLPFLGVGAAPMQIRYEDLEGLPTICGKKLIGDITEEDLADMGIQQAGDYPDAPLTASDIDAIIDEADSEE